MSLSTSSNNSNSSADKVSQSTKDRVGALYPGLRPLVFRVLEDVYLRCNRRIGVAQGMRSMEEQLSLYAKGRTLSGGKWSVTSPGEVVTNAKPGLSFHCYGLAFDAAWSGLDPYLQKETRAEQEELWRLYGEVGKSHGFKWGGDFRLANGARDLPHLEMAYGLSLAELTELHERGGLKAVWAYIDKLRGVPEGQDWNLPKEGA